MDHVATDHVSSNQRKRLADARDCLPWRDAHCLLRTLGQGAGDRALECIRDFEDGCDYASALWWGRIYLAIIRIESGERPPGGVLH